MHTARLENVAIASPCSADWNQMQGDDRSRLCAQCKLRVHDLSAMTTAEAEAVLRGVGSGRVCVRLFRRADGRVLTKDCPVGLREKVRRARARIAALWLALWSGTAACSRTIATPTPPELRATMGEAVAMPQPTDDDAKK